MLIATMVAVSGCYQGSGMRRSSVHTPSDHQGGSADLWFGFLFSLYEFGSFVGGNPVRRAAPVLELSVAPMSVTFDANLSKRVYLEGSRRTAVVTFPYFHHTYGFL